MSSYVYLLSFIVIACQFLIPIYLLVSLSIVANPLLVHIVEVEKFRYYKGTSAPNLTILFLLVLGSFLVRYILNKNTGSLETYEDLFLILLPIFIAQMTLVMLFEVKAPRSLFKKVISVYRDPRTLFIGDKLEFKEPEKKNITNQAGFVSVDSETTRPEISSKDLTIVEEDSTSNQFDCASIDSKPTYPNFSNYDLEANGISDMFKNLGYREFNETISVYEHFFKDNASIDNLFDLNNGKKIKPKSIKMYYDSDTNSKTKVAEPLVSLFEIEKKWNSSIKGHTNTQKVDFFNKYILINDDKKNELHLNNFTRSFDSKK